MIIDYNEYIRSSKEQTLVDSFRSAVETGMWPFRTGPVTLYSYQDGLNPDLMRVDIEFQDHPDLNIDWYIKSDDLLNYAEDVVIATDLGQRLVDFYRTRPAKPIPDNIKLGEN